MAEILCNPQVKAGQQSYGKLEPNPIMNRLAVLSEAQRSGI